MAAADSSGEESGASQAKRLNQGKGLHVVEFAGIGHAGQLSKANFDDGDVLVIFGKTAAGADAIQTRIGCKIKVHAFRGNARCGPHPSDMLHRAQSQASFPERLAAHGILGPIVVDHAGDGFEQIRFFGREQHRRAQLPYQHREFAHRIVRQNRDGIAMMLDLPLDELVVRQANAGNEIFRPALIGDLGVNDLGAHAFPGLRGPGLSHISSRRSRIGRWPASSFSRASSGENQPPRSTSGKDCIRPERGGHSISNKLPLTLEASQLPSTAQASTCLPLGCLKAPSETNSPSTAKPVSSWNSRRAQARASSPSSSRPFGMDQAPASLFFQNGPPGCTRKTSMPFAALRYIKTPAVRFTAKAYRSEERRVGKECRSRWSP